jgi:hypothetical protein
LFLSFNLYAEENIIAFPENMALNVYGNYNLAAFDHEDIGYRTDKPWDIGFGLRYKDFSFSIIFPIPYDGLLISPNFDFEVNSFFDTFFLEGYLKYYPNLYFNDTGMDSGFEIHSAGIMANFLYNHENHSLSSIINLNKKQNKSSGSLLYGFGIYHSSLYSEDEDDYYSERQHIIYMGPTVGYSYTFVFNNGVFLNTSIIFKANAGVNIIDEKWIFIPQTEPKIIFGCHRNTWSFNLKLMNNVAFLLWNINEFDSLNLITINFMFSKRIFVKTPY